AVGGGNDLFDFGAAQQGWCAAAEKETDDLAPAEALRLFCEIRRDCLKQWRVIGAARAIDVEIAIRADGAAVWPVHIDASRAHLSDATSFSNARARWVSGSFSSCVISPNVRFRPCGSKIGS